MAVTVNGKAAVVPSKAHDTIKRMSDAASAFLASLGKPELAKATFPFAGDERYDWHYTPVDRNGLLISEMTPNQTKLAFEMMETGYGASGYAMARQIIRLETILGEYEAMTSNVSSWHRLEERYWFSVFGEPGSEEPWDGASADTTSASSQASSATAKFRYTRSSSALTRPRLNMANTRACGHWQKRRTGRERWSQA